MRTYFLVLFFVLSLFCINKGYSNSGYIDIGGGGNGGGGAGPTGATGPTGPFGGPPGPTGATGATGADGGVASVTASAPLTSSGGSNPNIELTFPLNSPTGSFTSGYCFDLDTCVFSTGDGNISIGANGTPGITLDYPGDVLVNRNLAVNGTISAANFPPTGATNTVVGFDNSGALNPIPGWFINATTSGLNQNITVDPAVVGSQTLNNWYSAVSPSADAANSYLGHNFIVQYDPSNIGFAMDHVDGASVDQDHLGDGTVGFMRAFFTNQVVGNGLTTGRVTQLNNADLVTGIAAGATVHDGRGVFVQLNQQGTLEEDYAAVDINSNGNSIGRHLDGVRINLSNATGGNSHPLSVNTSGSVGDSLIQLILGNQSGGTVVNGMSAISGNNEAAIGGTMQGFVYFNNGHVAQNESGISYFSNADVDGNVNLVTASHGGGHLIGGSFLAENLNNQSNTTGQSQIAEWSSTGDTGTGMKGLNLHLAGTNASGQITGVNIDLSGAIATSGEQKQGMIVNDGVLSVQSNFDTSINTASGEFQQNIIGGNFHIAAGHPISGAYGFGNNLGPGVIIDDDMAADNILGTSSLGYSVNGFVNQIQASSGKTLDTINYMTAGGGITPASSGGTITNASLFRGIGFLPEGGSLTITNLWGLKIEPLLDAAGATNEWGVWIGATGADNWFAKDVVIGGSTGKPTGAYALDVTGDALHTGNILAGADSTYTIGAVGTSFETVYVNHITDVNDAVAVDAQLRQLLDGASVIIADWSVDNLKTPQGVALTTSGAQPPCDIDHRGLMWNVQGGAGVADIFQICQKNAADAYVWTTH